MTLLVQPQQEARARMPEITKRDREASLAWAMILRDRGLNPLPSHETLRHPVYPFRQYWEQELPLHYFDNYKSSMVQVMCGRHWGLIVIDLDGDGAKAEFTRMAEGRGALPKHWVCHSGGGGMHHWFSIPKDHPRKMPCGPLWEGEGKHNRIDRICDGGLIVCPPSIHPKTGIKYRWASKWESPEKLHLPGPCPKWLLNLPTLHEKKRAEIKAKHDIPGSERFAHIPKIATASAWGIRFTGRSRGGWHECHSPFREDSNPSAAVHEDWGHFRDFGDGEHGSLTFVQLAVAMNIYSSFGEAIKGLTDGK
jgi:hypothetical protein